MGASLALAGAGGCIRMPEEKLAPYAHRPPSRTPGEPVTYATAMELGGIAQGLLVTSYDGRPIKIEGNPSHPLNRGACDAIAQASILELYDPDRSRGVIRRNADGTRNASSWEEFARWAKGVFRGDGRGICVLSEVSSSPSLADMRKRFRKALPKAGWFEYEPHTLAECRDLPIWRQAPDISKARVIVCLDADLFGPGDPMAVKHARDFADHRRLQGSTGGRMNRLYMIESGYSVTGACADHRLAAGPGAVEAVAGQIAAALGLSHVPVKDQIAGVDKPFIDAIVTDLKANEGRSAVVAGAGCSEIVRDLVLAINNGLGNLGKTIFHYDAVDSDDLKLYRRGQAVAELLRKIHAGEVGALLILGGNPAYDAPADLKFADALGKVNSAVHLALHDDETSQLCRWHLSRAHFLESWGDARTYDGTASLVQPLIEPLFDGRSAIEVLAMILGDEQGVEGGGLEIVRRTFRSLLGQPFSEWKWKKALAEGIVEGTQVAGSHISVYTSDASQAPLPFSKDDAEAWAKLDAAAPRARLPPMSNSTRPSSFPTARSTTAGSPTTAGSRKCRSR